MKAGDYVKWESQAGGSWKEKKGTVVAIVPARKNVWKFVPKSAKKSHIKFDTSIGLMDRILVAVPAGKNKQITHYYCPTKKMLEEQGN